MCLKSLILIIPYAASDNSEKPNKYKKCGKALPNIQTLLKIKIHSKEKKKYKFKEGGEPFFQHSQIILHVRIHSRDKP